MRLLNIIKTPLLLVLTPFSMCMPSTTENFYGWLDLTVWDDKVLVVISLVLDIRNISVVIYIEFWGTYQ